MPEIIWKSSTEKINGNMQESEICILMQSFKIYYPGIYQKELKKKTEHSFKGKFHISFY